MRHRLRKMYTIHKIVLSELDKQARKHKTSKSRIVENALIDYLKIEIGSEELKNVE